MMNKKAIAAFAAGATLLAGFAMATPAFAETPTAPKITKSQAAKDVKTAKDNLDKAQGELKALEAGKEEAKAPTIAGVTLTDCYTTKDGKFEPVEAKIGALKEEQAKLVRKYINEYNAHVDYTKKAEEVQKLDAAYNKALREQAEAVDDPTTPSEDDQKDAAIARVRTAAADLQTKIEKKQKTYAEYLKKKSAYNAAKEKVSACKEAVKAAEDALNDFMMSGETDSKREDHLNDVLDRAKAKLTAAETKQTKAEGEYKEAKQKATDAKSLWKDAVKEYHAAYDHAVSLDVDPTKLPVVSTAADPLDNDFLDLPSTSNGVAPAGKNGAQAGANGAAAGKAGAANGSAAAGAKTEVENKNGKDKRGNAHATTGVGVTLTALAATMLAGMGAAVRKARH
ncbi:hypothetical protein HXT36_05365 [Gardnerella sp. DNF01144]|uniref:hypothetical protein n=1 Tax=Gardnerella sp. DNF01144 TaxID=2749058 RepID=UPI003BAAE647